jgi:hypothetical protein
MKPKRFVCVFCERSKGLSCLPSVPEAVGPGITLPNPLTHSAPGGASRGELKVGRADWDGDPGSGRGGARGKGSQFPETPTPAGRADLAASTAGLCPKRAICRCHELSPTADHPRRALVQRRGAGRPGVRCGRHLEPTRAEVGEPSLLVLLRILTKLLHRRKHSFHRKHQGHLLNGRLDKAIALPKTARIGIESVDQDHGNS